MNTLTKLALGMMGRLQLKAPEGDALRVWFDRSALARAMHLEQAPQILLTQTTAQPKPASA